MSHDRGCFRCGDDPPYMDCKRADCPKQGSIGKVQSAAARTVLDQLRTTPRRPTQIVTVTEPGYDVAVFLNEDGGGEVIITRPKGKPTNVNFAPPEPGRRIVVERKRDIIAVLYKDVAP